MAQPRIIRIAPFQGILDEGWEAKPSFGISGGNWFAGRDGKLRPGPSLHSYTPDACEEEAVLSDPSTLDYMTLKELAGNSGSIYLHKYISKMIQLGETDDDDTLSELFSVTAGSSAEAKWDGVYFTQAEISALISDMRIRALYNGMVEVGITKVWFLDERILVQDSDTGWTTSIYDPCGIIVNSFDDLTMVIKDAILIEYDDGCLELFGYFDTSFLLTQNPEYSPDLGEVLSYKLELPFFATNGTLSLFEKTHSIKATGEEETGEINGALPGVSRWPMLDRDHLSDPNLINLGICGHLDGSGATEEVHKWTADVYHSPHPGWAGMARSDDATPGGSWSGTTYSSMDELWSLVWKFRDDLITGPFDNDRDDVFHVSHTEVYGSTLCEFISTFGGVYQFVAPGATRQWNDHFLQAGSDITYEETQLPPGIQSPFCFLIVWKGKCNIPIEGLYRFYACVDEGVHLSIDGEAIIDWGDEKSEEFIYWDSGGSNFTRRGIIQAGGDGWTDIRYVVDKYLKAGTVDVELRWWNHSPSFIFHVDICPKPYLKITSTHTDAGWGVFEDGLGMEAERYGIVFPKKCYYSSPTSMAPDNAAPCCAGFDSVFACKGFISEFFMRTDTWKTLLPAGMPEYELIRLEDPTECFQIGEE